MTTARVRPINGLPLAGQLDGSEVIPAVQGGAAVSMTADKLAARAALLVPPGNATKQSVGLGSVDNLSASALASPGNVLGDTLAQKISQGPFRSLLETAAVVNLPKTPTQNTGAFRGRQITERLAPAGRPDWAYSGDGVLVKDQGAGINGPQSAAYGRTTMVFKDGYPSTSSNKGEIDLQLFLGQQSGPTATSIDDCSDMDGIQGLLRLSGDCGFAAGMEWNVGRIDPTTFADTHVVATAMAVHDPFGKNQEQGIPRYQAPNPLSFGFFAAADKGALDRGVFVTNGGAGTWEWFHFCGAGNSPRFRVRGGTGTDQGSIVLGPDGTNFVIGRDPGGNLTIDTANGTNVFTAYQSGQLVIPQTLNVSRVSVAGSEMLRSSRTVVYPPLTGAPASPLRGETYFDDALNKVRTWDGTAWQAHW